MTYGPGARTDRTVYSGADRQRGSTVLEIGTEVTVAGVTGAQVTEFMLTPDDGRYRAWWPGTHLQFHLLRAGARDHRGDVVLMDEYVGTRRVRMNAEVLEAVSGERIVWRLRAGRLPLPVRVTLALRDEPGSVRVRHTISAGWRGPGVLLDPLWRLVFTRSFAQAMDEHARTEFPRLGALLR